MSRACPLCIYIYLRSLADACCTLLVHLPVFSSRGKEGTPGCEAVSYQVSVQQDKGKQWGMCVVLVDWKCSWAPQISNKLLKPFVSWEHGSNWLKKQEADETNIFYVLSSLTIIGQHWFCSSRHLSIYLFEVVLLLLFWCFTSTTKWKFRLTSKGSLHVKQNYIFSGIHVAMITLSSTCFASHFTQKNLLFSQLN